MEYLDFYDEHGNFLGKDTRNNVHIKGLWHKTIHCWLHDGAGNVYFQIRADLKKLYTTASGHIAAGESLSEAFAREVKEEIGVDVDPSTAKLLEMIVWTIDKKKADGSEYHDRVFANIYLSKIDEPLTRFRFDENEVIGIVKMSAADALKILRSESGTAKAIRFGLNGKTDQIEVVFGDFLVNPKEIGIVKYGYILQEILKFTEEKK